MRFFTRIRVLEWGSVHVLADGLLHDSEHIDGKIPILDWASRHESSVNGPSAERKPVQNQTDPLPDFMSGCHGECYNDTISAESVNSQLRSKGCSWTR